MLACGCYTLLVLVLTLLFSVATLRRRVLEKLYLQNSHANVQDSCSVGVVGEFDCYLTAPARFQGSSELIHADSGVGAFSHALSSYILRHVQRFYAVCKNNTLRRHLGNGVGFAIVFVVFYRQECQTFPLEIQGVNQLRFAN